MQAQSSIDIRIAISKEIAQHTNWTPVFQKHKTFAYLFAIAVSYDGAGKVDTVYFTQKMSDELNAVLRPKALTLFLMKSKYLPNQYKDKVVMYPVIYKYPANLTVAFDQTWQNSWVNLWPILSEKHRNKYLVLLQPYENDFLREVN